MTLLTKSAAVLAKLETTAGVDSLPVVGSDLMLVTEPDVTVDPNILERNIVSCGLSPFPHVVGRKVVTVTFGHELRSNGLTHSGNLADAPTWARLLEACGYAPVAMAGDEENVSAIQPDSQNSAAEKLVFAASVPVSVSVTQPVVYTLTCTLGGGTGVATYSLTNNAPSVDDLSTPATGLLEDLTAIPLGASGVEITPDFTAGPAVTGSKWRIVVYPNGIIYKPISTGQKTITLYVYFDGLLHKVVGAMGTFTIEAEAGNYGMANFTFTGSYVDVIDAPLPPCDAFDTILPPQVELANLTWNSKNDLVVSAWNFDQANTVTPRPDLNKSDGFFGVRISSRAPSGGFDPESVLVAEADFWGDMAKGYLRMFHANVGRAAGNRMSFTGRAAQMNSNGYGDRDGIRVYEVGMLFKRHAGDDEFEIAFC